jgi:putative resolvase
MLITIKEASKILGVSIQTLRRWEISGKIKSVRTEGNHRRYDSLQLTNVKSDDAKTVAYARVSSFDQKEDLVRQVGVLESYCSSKGFIYEIIQDLGSGMNYKKKGLVRLIKMICNNEVDRLILCHKDRLLRFGSDLIFMLCEHFGTEVIIINRSADSSFEEDLTADVLEIITVFSARLYGSRSHKNKKIMAELNKISQELK